MSYRRLYLLFITIACFSLDVSAQESLLGSVKGMVVDEATQKPLQYVTVAVRKITDHSVVTGQMTDSLGKFLIENIPEGDYDIMPSMIGYEAKHSYRFQIDAERKVVDLKIISLSASSIAMDEVQIIAEKMLYTTSIDRKTYNVERDLIGHAGSASELLQNVPSVSVDIDGNVSLRGSSNVMIMINGRTSPLMNRNSAGALENMPANTIEKIEVITNPTAEFKPDAAAGIINIVMKKNSGAGFNGSLTGNAGSSNRLNSSLNLNYNPGKSKLYANYSIRKAYRKRTSDDNRTQSDTSFTYYSQRSNSVSKPLPNTISAGYEYQPNKFNQFGINGSYFFMDMDRKDQADYNLYNADHILNRAYTRFAIEDQSESEQELSAFYEHAFNKEDHTLRVECTLAMAPETEDNQASDVYTVPSSSRDYEKTVSKSKDNTNQISVEYANPLSDETSIKAGYSVDFDQSEYDFRTSSFDTTVQDYVIDATRSNLFRGNETIHAVFGTYKHSFGKLGMVTGLRGEYASVRSSLVTLDSTVTQSYSSLYPSLHLSYELNKAAELQFSYSKRTRRPDMDDLNPFPEYSDPRNIRSGNPKLKPEYIHSLELGCQYRIGEATIIPALFYRYTYNRFTWITKALNDTVLLTTHDNLSNDQSGGFELNLSGNIGEIISIHGNGSVYRNEIDASDFSSGKKSVTTWSSNLIADMNVTGSTRFQLSSNYRSAQLTAQGKNAPSYTLNAGLRQELLKGKVSLLATITDIFHTMKRNYTLDTATLHQSTHMHFDSRTVFVGFTYRFGSQPKKSRNEQFQYDESQ